MSKSKQVYLFTVYITKLLISLLEITLIIKGQGSCRWGHRVLLQALHDCLLNLDEYLVSLELFLSPNWERCS